MALRTTPMPFMPSGLSHACPEPSRKVSMSPSPGALQLSRSPISKTKPCPGRGAECSYKALTLWCMGWCSPPMPITSISRLSHRPPAYSTSRSTRASASSRPSGAARGRNGAWGGWQGPHVSVKSVHPPVPLTHPTPVPCRLPPALPGAETPTTARHVLVASTAKPRQQGWRTL